MITRIQPTSVTPPNVPPSEPVKSKVSFKGYSDEEIADLREQNAKLREMSHEGGIGSVVTKGLLAAGTGAVAMATASIGWKQTGEIITKMAKSGTVKGVEGDVSKMASSTKNYFVHISNLVKKLSFVKKASAKVSDFFANNSLINKIKQNKHGAKFASAVKTGSSKTKEQLVKMYTAAKKNEIARKGFAGAAGITAGAEALGIETKADRYQEAS